MVYGRRVPRYVPIMIGATGDQVMELTGEIAGVVVLNYCVSPENTYTLRLGESWQPISYLMPAECQTSRAESYWGSWLLTFNPNDPMDDPAGDSMDINIGFFQHNLVYNLIRYLYKNTFICLFEDF